MKKKRIQVKQFKQIQTLNKFLKEIEERDFLDLKTESGIDSMIYTVMYSKQIGDIEINE